MLPEKGFCRSENGIYVHATGFVWQRHSGKDYDATVRISFAEYQRQSRGRQKMYYHAAAKECSDKTLLGKYRHRSGEETFTVARNSIVTGLFHLWCHNTSR